MLKRAAHAVVNRMGFELVRRPHGLRGSWLGLRGRDVRLVVDVGANVGQFAGEAHRVFPRAAFLCVEPLPDVAGLLEQYLTLRGIRGRVLRVALGEARGQTRFFRHVGHTASSSLLRTTTHGQTLYPQTTEQETVSVTLETLDAVADLTRYADGGETLLKLDVQGAELRVLRGARRTLPLIDHVLCEVNFDPLYEGQPSFAEIHEELHESGFRYAGALRQFYDANGRVVFADQLFSRRTLRAAKLLP